MKQHKALNGYIISKTKSSPVLQPEKPATWSTQFGTPEAPLGEFSFFEAFKEIMEYIL